jgi:hypothetical protein
MRWARPLKRVFHMDVERCACGGPAMSRFLLNRER